MKYHLRGYCGTQHWTNYATRQGPRSWKMLRLHETGVIALAFLCVVKSADFTFPKDFFLGTASAAYQTEGAWNVDGKSENNWDHKTHVAPFYIVRNASGDDACKSYYKYKEDVQIMKNLGFDAHRFSVSWSRILPDGVLGRINRKGLEFYKNFTQELIDNNIKPIVTIYHWDHPYVLEEKGGWLNEKMVDWLVDYARIVIEELGPMVPIFITINEITDYCRVTYDFLSTSNKETMSETTEYNVPKALRCIHNMLKAHAKVYHMYDEKYRPIQRGQIGFVTSCRDLIPRNASNPSDIAFAEIARDFDCGIVTHPIWIGDYPKSVKKRIAKTSKTRGYSTSALLKFSPAWVDYIRGTSDFFGLNYYNSHTILPDHGADSKTRLIARVVTDPRKRASGLRRILSRIKNKYKNLPIFVSENGYISLPGLFDPERVEFFNLMLKEMLKSIRIDGANVTGYLIWSLLDLFEWPVPYEKFYGIVQVDFTSPDRERTPKLSAKWWKEVLESRDLDAVDTISYTARNNTNVDESSTESRSGGSSSKSSWSLLRLTLVVTCIVIFGNESRE